MKKLKIKLEYAFEVPDDTTILEHDWHGLFVVNDRLGVKSKPDLNGIYIQEEKYNKKGMLQMATLAPDSDSLVGFLYNDEDSCMVTEKTTIEFDGKKFSYRL